MANHLCNNPPDSSGPHKADDEVSLEAIMEDNVGFKNFMSSGTPNSVGHSRCIRRATVQIRRLKEAAYIPSIVSIGPLHRQHKGQKDQWITRKEKGFYTLFLLKRIRLDTGDAVQVSQIKKDCAKAMSDMQAYAREYYTEEDIKGLDDIRFAEMMMIDGCFIIELLCRHSRNEFDPILIDDSKRSQLQNDLILLENQIPFPVLEKLFDLTVGRIPEDDKKKRDHPSLTKYVLSFLGNKMGLEDSVVQKKQLQETEREAPPVHHALHIGSQAMECSIPISSEEAGQSKSERQVYHILHLLHSYHVRSQAEETGQSKPEGQRAKEPGQSKSEGCKCVAWRSESKEQSKSEGCKSATQLDANGLKLEARSTGYLFDVKFKAPSCSLPFSNVKFKTPCGLLQLCRRCRLQIPSFIIDDSTETFLRNMIAFEQCCPGIERYFTSHAFLMDQLINSEEDVKLLEDAGIIRTNYLGSREEVNSLFNRICKNVHLGDNLFQVQCERVKTYCDLYWPARRQKLSRDYCSSPWAWISVLAAIILFVLTLLQTIYTMLSFY